MVEQLSMSYLTGPAYGRYLKWEITNPHFWAAASAQKPVTELISSPRCPPAPNSVFVEITDGGPLGHYIELLVKHPRYVTGLFIQAYGIENKVPCRLCEQRFMKSDGGGKAGMWPFFGCKSIPAFSDYSCGNCVSGVEGHNCSFRDDRFDHLRARWNSQPLIESDLTDKNSPELSDVRYKGKRLKRFLRYYNEERSG